VSHIIHEASLTPDARPASAGPVRDGEDLEQVLAATDVRSIWRAPSWATDSRVGDGSVYHCLEAPVLVQARAGDRPQMAGLLLCQTDTVTITDGRIRAVRGRPEVLLEDVTLTLEQAEAMAAALLRLVAAGRSGAADAVGGSR
jgi:hypothetical protein